MFRTWICFRSTSSTLLGASCSVLHGPELVHVAILLLEVSWIISFSSSSKSFSSVSRSAIAQQTLAHQTLVTSAPLPCVPEYLARDIVLCSWLVSEPPTASRNNGTGVLWVLTGTHRCDDPPRQGGGSPERQLGEPRIRAR